jgi:hypothetical protein
MKRNKMVGGIYQASLDRKTGLYNSQYYVRQLCRNPQQEKTIVRNPDRNKFTDARLLTVLPPQSSLEHLFLNDNLKRHSANFGVDAHIVLGWVDTVVIQQDHVWKCLRFWSIRTLHY